MTEEILTKRPYRSIKPGRTLQLRKVIGVLLTPIEYLCWLISHFPTLTLACAFSPILYYFIPEFSLLQAVGMGLFLAYLSVHMTIAFPVVIVGKESH